MTNFIKLFALLFAVAAAVFYCKISDAHWGKSNGILSTADICTNQAMTDGDRCDTYIITD